MAFVLPIRFSTYHPFYSGSRLKRCKLIAVLLPEYHRISGVLQEDQREEAVSAITLFSGANSLILRCANSYSK